VSWELKTPVSVFFYRRPDHLRQVMAKVREARPPVLFGISDGPKPGDPEIQKGVEESRRVFREAIDWPCRLELLERETNLGSYRSVSRGLDWVFERVGETIVLEDDTVPDLTFFRFVEELLDKYRDDERVGAISGNNYDEPKDWSDEASYRFTRYHHSWGWGTWRRAWRAFDREEKLLAEVPRIRKENWPKLSRGEWTYWERCFQRTFAGKLDAWDYRWTLSLWKHHMVCVIPRVNLVRNIGFDEKATHTVEQEFADLIMHDSQSIVFPLNQMKKLNMTRSLDNQVFKSHYKALEGRRGMVKKLLDRIKKFFKQKGIRSSISDTRQYREVCLESANNEKTFSQFKRDSRYTEILEHTSYELGRSYLNEIKKSENIYKKIKLFCKNDRFGNPELLQYPEIGSFSPSTLRYIKVLADLVERFGALTDLDITEIGGGYGGQCLVIHAFAKIKSYRIFDLPEVLLLSEKYLKRNGVESVDLETLESFLSSRSCKIRYPGLVISNYAFSEINSEIQMQYLKNIILKSRMGYMTVNTISGPCGVDSLSIEAIVRTLENVGPVVVEPEKPLTHEGNKLIWWNWGKSIV